MCIGFGIIFFLKIDFIYLFMPALGLECGLSLVAVRGGGAIAVASLVAEHGL